MELGTVFQPVEARVRNCHRHSPWSFKMIQETKVDLKQLNTSVLGNTKPRFIHCLRDRQGSYCETDYLCGQLLLDRGKETDEVVRQFVKNGKQYSTRSCYTKIHLLP